VSTSSSIVAVGRVIGGTVVVDGPTDVVVDVATEAVLDASDGTVVVAVVDPDSLRGSVPHAVAARSAVVRRTSPNRMRVLGWPELVRAVRCRSVSMGFMGRHDRPKG
jgi:uncharacterized membrane protein